jgi:TfoX/Sxy family transcriptional regulator of competence genes
MAYNEQLADRVREALADIPRVEEKKMFRGVTFMVNGKMCVSVGGDELMCRIDPEKHSIAIEKNGCREMIHGGRTMKGFVFVDVGSIQKKKDFDYWITLALDFNKKAKASPKKKGVKKKRV